MNDIEGKKSEKLIKILALDAVYKPCFVIVIFFLITYLAETIEKELCRC